MQCGKIFPSSYYERPYWNERKEKVSIRSASTTGKCADIIALFKNCNNKKKQRREDSVLIIVDN